MTTVSYVPGTATAVVTPSLVVLTAGNREVAQRIWELGQDSVDLVRVLEALSTGGLAELPAFAAIALSGDSAQMFVRGDFRITLQRAGVTEEFEAAELATWAEQRVPLHDVASVSLCSPAGESGARFSIQSGVVLAASVRVATGASEVGEPDAARASIVSHEVAVEEAAEEPSRPPAIVETAPEPVPEPIAEVDAAGPDEVEPADPGVTLIETEDFEFEAMFGATVMGRTPEDAAVRDEAIDEPGGIGSPVGAPVDPDLEVEDRTVTRAELRRKRGEAPRAVSPPPPASVRCPARLVLSTGREVLVEQPVVIGRAPQMRNTSSAGLPLLVKVDDPFVSSTHLEIATNGDDLVATDVSSNGTLLTQPGAPRVPMRKHEPTTLRDGAVLHISDSISITVTLP